MESHIHPTAVVDARARIAPGTVVGPCTVIDADVDIGPNCWFGPQVHVTGRTEIGAGNRFHAGCVIGDAPQDLKYKGEPTRLRIGDNNIFREHVTVHRSNKVEEATEIGSNNLFMANSHAGHNCRIGNHVIIANGALLGGHVQVDDRVFISGNCLLHQFVRIGTLTLMQGGAGASMDVPPFTIASGQNAIAGLNVIGLRRAGATAEQRIELRRLYHLLFRSGRKLRESIEIARAQFTGELALALIEFVAGTRRGVCPDRRRRRNSLEVEE